MSVEVKAILDRMKQCMLARGARGPTGIHKLFTAYDTDGSGALDYEEFQQAMKELELALSNQDIRTLFGYFDEDGNKMIEYPEFVGALCGDLTSERELTCRHVFENLDTDNDGIVSIKDIGRSIDPKGHPTVAAGKMTPMEFMSELIVSFEDSGCAPGGKITSDSFCQYYRLAASFMDDPFFNDMMSNMWHAPDAGAASGALRSKVDNRPKSLAVAMNTKTVDDVLSRVREELKRRGARGIVGLGRKFRIMDDDGSKSLDTDEFTKGMNECSLSLAKEDIISLFNYFDKDRSGTIGYEEFLHGLRGVMSERRKKLVLQAFDVMDKDGNGFIEPADVANTYSAKKHPDVIAGKRTEKEVLEEFLETFDVGGEKDGKVTKNEFCNYYSNVSSSIDNDDYFELMIRNAWHISGGEGWCANSSNMRVLVTHSDGTKSVEEIKNDLGLKRDDKEGMIRRLKAQGVDVVKVDASGGVDDESEPAGGGKVKSLAQSAAARSAREKPRQVAAGGIAGQTTKKAPQSLSALSRRNNTSSLQAGMSEAARSIAAKGGRTNPTKPAVTTAAAKPPSATMSPGLGAICARMKEKLKKRGARGIVGLGRAFRIMDDDGSKSLNMAEFKKAMVEMEMGLSESEMRQLFTHFDADSSGSIDFEEFLLGMRDPLTPRRLALVDQAFAVVDSDGSGVIEPNEMIEKYDASKHPDVIQGKKTPEQVMEEFMATFEVGEEVDGKVTITEFRNYYTNLGVSIDNDDYFELMIRNAWHISGGEGWCANSANRRVLVTHSDGTQTVEEIQHDLGIKADDKDEMKRRLLKQGVDAQDISTFDGGDDGVGKKAAGKQKSLAEMAPSRKTKPSANNSSSIKSHLAAAQSRPPPAQAASASPPPPPSSAQSIAAMGPKSGPAGKKSAAAAAPAPVRNATPSKPKKEAPAGTQLLVKKLKDALANRGARGFIGLQRKFRIMDDDGSKTLNLAEFKKGLTESGLGLPENDMRMLYQHFDGDGSGTVDFEEFIQGLRDPLNERRLTLVRLAFAKLDKDGNGELQPAEVAEAYDASQHPEVIAGRMTEDQVFREFLDTFDVGGVKDGMVTREEFENYYTNLGANIDNDDYFELMIRNAWHISGGEGWCANSANRRVLVTHNDGTQTVEEIQNDLGIKADDKDTMVSRLREQGLDVNDISLFDSAGDDDKDGGGKAFGKKSSFKTKTRVKRMNAQQSRSSAEPGVLPGTGGAATRQSAKKANVSLAARNAKKSDAPLGVVSNIAHVKQQLAARGARGLIGLGRKFRIMDDDGSKSLDMGEFKKAMREMNMDLSSRELEEMFHHFDQDGGATIDYEEFIQGLRDPLTPRRLDLVKQAFKVIDKDGSGIVEPGELVDTYDCSKHPEVIAGRMTKEQVMLEFLDTFDVGGEKDGKVTEGEFINYYTNIGANIDNEDYFELMIRNAWHISGGEGAAANSANRRVLVTHNDGTQSVEEIKHDLGVKADDKDEMVKRLKAQGVDVSGVSIAYGDKGKPDKKGNPPPTLAQAAPKNPKLSGTKSLAAMAKAKKGVGSPSKANVAAGMSVKDRSLANHGSGGVVGNAMKDLLGPSRAGAASSFAKSSKKDKSHLVSKADIETILVKLRAGLKAHGAHGMTGFARKFKIMDDDGSGGLNFAEFKKGMIETGLDFSDNEMHALFSHFDPDNSGSIDYDEFIWNGVSPPMDDGRLKLVDAAFAILDTDGNGIIDASEVASKYDASKHPDVIQGKKTPEQVLEEFLSTFEVGEEVDGKCTKAEFVNYYQRLSASIDNDDYFELMMRNAWHISGGEGWCANSSNIRVLVTHSDGTKSVEEIKNDLGLKRDDKAGMLKRLREQGVDAKNVDTSGSCDDEADGGGGKNPGNFKTLQQAAAAGSHPRHGVAVKASDGAFAFDKRGRSTSRKSSYTKDAFSSQLSLSHEPGAKGGNQGSSKSIPKGVTAQTMSHFGPGMMEVPPDEEPPAGGKRRGGTSLAAATEKSRGAEEILTKLREQLKKRGTKGIVGLGRKFKIMDDDNSNTIDKSEFKKGMRETQVELNNAELEKLFNYFDKDGGGDISYEEFLNGVRGKMNERRVGMVMQAFDVLDKDGSGIVEPADIINVFDASKHPDVISGKKTPNEIFHEFLDTFDVGGEKDGLVTKQEFKNYYDNVSASIDNDDYFELMIRNTWHITGGEGWCANTSNRRVLVTHNDGTQSVEEIKHDLGVKADDKDEMVKRLKAQGVDVSGVSIAYGDKGKPDKKGKPGAKAPELPGGRKVNPSFRSTFSLAHG